MSNVLLILIRDRWDKRVWNPFHLSAESINSLHFPSSLYHPCVCYHPVPVLARLALTNSQGQQLLFLMTPPFSPSAVLKPSPLCLLLSSTRE